MTDALAVARKLLDLVLDLVPHDEAAKLLTDAAIRRQNAAADVAEATKFGGDVG